MKLCPMAAQNQWSQVTTDHRTTVERSNRELKYIIPYYFSHVFCHSGKKLTHLLCPIYCTIDTQINNTHRERKGERERDLSQTSCKVTSPFFDLHRTLLKEHNAGLQSLFPIIGDIPEQLLSLVQYCRHTSGARVLLCGLPFLSSCCL